MTDTLTVVIASPLEEEHVARIRSVPGIRVLHDPDLIPAPQHEADHLQREQVGLMGK